MDVEAAKRAAGDAAAALVEEGMHLGFGTGSTARWFLIAVGRRVQAGLRVSGVATSYATERLARELDLPLHPLSRSGLDLAVDGADQVDPALRLVKGAGGALVREKIVAAAARHFVVIIDDSKLTDQLSGTVPVEIVPFGVEGTLRLLEGTGARFWLRETPDGDVERSENGNLIADGVYPLIEDPEGLAAALSSTPGVVDHGLFVGLAHTVLVGRADGTVEERRRTP